MKAAPAATVGDNMKPQNFNDLLALALMTGVFPTLWVLHGLKITELPEMIIGATIAIETMVAQYYFRKSKPNGKDIPMV